MNRLCRIAALVGFLTLFAGPSAYAALEPHALNAWEKTAFKAFQDDDYPKALKTLDAHKNERFAKVLTTFVHLQEWVFSQSKVQKQIWKGDYKSLQLSAGVDDIPYLSMIGQERDKPYSSKYAKKLLKRAFANITENKDVPALVQYLTVPDQEINSYAMKSLEKILKSRRKIVKKGGSLRADDISMMKDKGLLGQLTAIVSQQDVGTYKPSYQQGISHAMKCLVYIEEPSLEVLEKSSGLNVAKAKEKVYKAVNKRKKKFPNSNWYSSTGKERG